MDGMFVMRRQTEKYQCKGKKMSCICWLGKIILSSTNESDLLCAKKEHCQRIFNLEYHVVIL